VTLLLQLIVYYFMFTKKNVPLTSLVRIVFQELFVFSKQHKLLRVFHVHWNPRCIRQIFENPECCIGPRKRGSHCSRAADIHGHTCYPVSLQYLVGRWILSMTATEVHSFNGFTNDSYTPHSEKRCHFIFDYNSRNPWSIFYNFCTVGNRNEYSTMNVIYLLNGLMIS